MTKKETEAYITQKIIGFASTKDIDIVEFVDITTIPDALRRGYRRAVLIGTVLPKTYLERISPDGDIDVSEFVQKEQATDRLAEDLAGFLVSIGYPSYAQSESNIGNDGLIDAQTLSSILPHKTIALLSGIGWIGKNNLLVTPEYGSGFCMCTILTNAPILSEKKSVMRSKCGACDLCKTICPGHAITGNTWEAGCNRESLFDIALCEKCLKCLGLCIWTQRYVKGDHAMEAMRDELFETRHAADSL